MNHILFRLLTTVLYLLSLLPMRVLYLFSDFLYCLLRYVVRYRRKVIFKNLRTSFPDKAEEEISQVAARFYHFLADYMVESLKLCSMSEAEMRKRLTFENMEEVEAVMAQGKSITLYLGHYGNWEWISSLPLWISKEYRSGQIYHPLRNKFFDRFFLWMRGRFHAQSIAMDDTLQVLRHWKQEGETFIVGFIADQVPSYQSIHLFTDFLHHDTPVFTGAERIARMMENAVFYLDVERVKRGYYRCKLVKVSDNAQAHPTFFITEQYIRLLEASIRRTPHLWLWSHNRWKRTRQGFMETFPGEEGEKRLSRL